MSANRKGWGQRKPPFGSRLDRADPINVGIKACWPINEGGGPTVYDIANGYNGTFTAGSSNKPTWGAAQSGAAVVAAGASEYVSFPGITWNPVYFSVSFWLRPSTTADYNQQLGATGNWVTVQNGPGGFYFHTTATGGVYCGRDASTGRFSPTDIPAGTVVTDQWQFFCYTATLNQGVSYPHSFYKNGRLLASNAGGSLQGSWGGFQLGAPTSDTLNGRISMVRLHGRTLSAAEVLRLYNEPYAGIMARRRRMVAAATGTSTRTVTPTGGIVFAGAAAAARGRGVLPAGGLTFAGTAPKSSHTSAQSVTASGGLTFGGAAANARGKTHVPTGGLTLGGSAAMSSHVSSVTRTPSGGISFGGSASVSYVGGVLASTGYMFVKIHKRATLREFRFPP